MVESGLVVAVVGLILAVYGFLQRMKAARVLETPHVSTGEILRRKATGGAKGQISAQGRVGCRSPLVAPMTGQPCLFYRITCTAEWKDGDKKQSKVIGKEQYAAPFTIDDGTGPVHVQAGEGGDFDSMTRKKETKGTGLFGAMLGSDLMFGNYRVSTRDYSGDTKFTVEEEILPLQPALYANGKISEQGDSIVPPNWRSLLLSAKNRDQLLAFTTRSAKRNLAGGMAALLIGGGVSGTGHLFFSDDDEPSQSIASIAPTAAPPAPEPAPAPTPEADTPPVTPAAAPASPNAPAKPAKHKVKKVKTKKGVRAKR